MTKLIKLKRGLDIPISGKAKETNGGVYVSKQVALIPDYYHGITPKVLVKEGDEVKAGSPVFYNKAIETMNFVSPVSGKIIAVNRGERRKVLSIIIENDEKYTAEKTDIASVDKLSAEDIKSILLKAGYWTYIKQRPYDVIANPAQNPKSVFISTFDSAPAAPNYDFTVGQDLKNFQTGVDVLAKLTSGKVNIGLKNGNTVFAGTKNAEVTFFEGPHPVGNVGVQINHIDPVNKGEVVWTVNPQDVAAIGKLFTTGTPDFKKTVALTGPEVTDPQYITTVPGTNITELLAGKVTKGAHLRYICGNVLSGLQVNEGDFTEPYSNQISVIKEGDDVHELFGWAMPRFNKFSVSSTYFTGIAKLFGKKSFDYDARLMGGKRAIIMSGEYDKVFPMDVLPEFLIKAMIAGNIDKMEALGAYEVAPEDFALCEFVCTSKLPIQSITRQALDNLRKEVE